MGHEYEDLLFKSMENQKSIVMQWLAGNPGPPAIAQEGSRFKASKRKVTFTVLACHGITLGLRWKSSPPSGMTLGVRRESI
jgi:hypothetical protein